MEGEEQVGKYLVAGPAVYQITGVTPEEVVTIVLRPARTRPLEWPADREWAQHPEVRWPRRMLRLALQRRELRLAEVMPTMAEVEAERAGRLDTLLRKDHAETRKLVRERLNLAAPVPTDEWGQPLAKERRRA